MALASTLPSDFEISLEPLLKLGESNKLNGIIFLLDKSRTGSCKTLTKEQLNHFISRHGGGTAPMFTSEVTHVFSESEKAPLARSAAVAGIPILNSSQLAELIDSAYVLREVRRFEEEETERERERGREAKLKLEAEQRSKEEKKKAAKEKQEQKKKQRQKRTYSAELVKEEGKEKEKDESIDSLVRGVLDMVAVKMENGDDSDDVSNSKSGTGGQPTHDTGKAKRKRPEEEEESSLGSGVQQVKKAARVAKRRKRAETQPSGDEDVQSTTKKEHKEAKKGDGDEGGESSNGNDGGIDEESQATPMHQKRRRFEGKVFLLLGRFMQKQADMRSFIEENGGEVASSLTRKVTHLLTAQGDDGTITFKQARQRNLKIITEERLNEYMALARGKRQVHQQSSLQVPTTPVTSAAQRHDQVQRLGLTPMPSANTQPPVQMLFDASPSWKVIHYKIKKSKKEKKAIRKAKRSKKAKDQETPSDNRAE